MRIVIAREPCDVLFRSAKRHRQRSLAMKGRKVIFEGFEAPISFG